MAGGRFLTNHALALFCVAREPGLRLSDVAQRLGVTERAAHRLVDDLVKESYLTRHRVGRRSFYEVHPERPLGAPLVGDVEVGELLAVLLKKSGTQEEATG